jgi:hypothetical protein
MVLDLARTHTVYAIGKTPEDAASDADNFGLFDDSINAIDNATNHGLNVYSIDVTADPTTVAPYAED